MLFANARHTIKTEVGIRSRSIASPEDLFLKPKLHWLSDIYTCLVRHLCLTAKTLVSDVQNTCVCRLKHLCLSRQRIATVKQGESGRLKKAITETINDEAKNICQTEHTRKRSFANSYLFACKSAKIHPFLSTFAHKIQRTTL